MTLEEFNSLINGTENERNEFKAARSQFSFDNLCEYCIAIANERGGKLILGVTDAQPRVVCGTNAFPNLETLKPQILNRIRLRIEACELEHPQGRVLVFDIPSRPDGVPLELNGRYLMRSGESLVGMTQGQIRLIHDETGPDFSAELCPEATLDSLDPDAVELFRKRWHARTGNDAILNATHHQLLENAELLVDGQVTYAALILLGTSRALGRLLANSEVIYEYRGTDSQIEHSFRSEHREGFLLFHDRLWNQISVRNEVTSIREGLFRRDIQAFDEDAVREAILNAICHRDYRLGNSVFIRQTPKSLEIVSPGGFPPGISPANIVRRQAPRNRRLAEACAKCGLVERSGQGMDRIYMWSLRAGRGRPDFSGSDNYQVALTMRADGMDPRFLGLLDVATERKIDLNLEDLLILDSLRLGEHLPAEDVSRAHWLERLGLVERAGRGGSRRFILSRALFVAIGERAAYTRARGLDRETKKALLFQHVQHNARWGANLAEFCQVLPELMERQVRELVYELRSEGRMHAVGRGKSSRWFPGRPTEQGEEVDNETPGN